jgi:hypothetical protein
MMRSVEPSTNPNSFQLSFKSCHSEAERGGGICDSTARAQSGDDPVSARRPLIVNHVMEDFLL